MLKISLVAVGERMPSWVTHGFEEYQKRIRGSVTLELIEVPSLHRGKNADLKRISRDEEARILAAIPERSRLIALDRLGKSFSSEVFADKMQNWIDNSERVALVIGGPEGLSHDFLNQVDERWCLSELTFAHPLVRVVVAEQLYRCFSILQGSPYHR